MTNKTKSQKLAEKAINDIEATVKESDQQSQTGEPGELPVIHGHNKLLGKKGEDAAVRYLEHQGYEILERNWSCPAGEADIIALDLDTLVFLEVKTRTNVEKGLPEESVTPKKRSRYERIALYYLKDHTMPEMRVRFDVIGMTVYNDRSALLRHHVNAFGTE